MRPAMHLTLTDYLQKILTARVYDPFFTTRLGSGGSGLGLHATHNIVTGVLGGRIDLHSEVGAGSTFTLELPTVAPGFVTVAGG